jgi:predicted aspartyl protease
MISTYRSKFIIISFLSLFTYADASAQTVEVPFEFIHNEIVVKVMIDGKGPFNAMIDTGTDPSAIDISTAKQIGIEFGSKGHKSSGGGTDTNLNYSCKLSTLGVGSIVAVNVDAAAINLSKVSERMGAQIDAILGYSFLKKRIIEFDFPRRVVRFLERSAARASTQNGVTLPFRYKDDVLVDGVVVNGKTVTANLDTGSSGTFALSPRAIDDLGLAGEAASGKATASVGYNGISKNREGTIKNVTIGTISVDNAPVQYFGKGSGHDKVPWSINIGNAFMKDYVVTVNYRAKTVTFASSQP